MHIHSDRWEGGNMPTEDKTQTAYRPPPANLLTYGAAEKEHTGSASIGYSNRANAIVSLREIIESAEFSPGGVMLPLALGRNTAGDPAVYGLESIGNLLIGGASRAEISNCLNCLSAGLLFARPPEELKLILFDPRVGGLAAFDGVPHLACPVITSAVKASKALNWLIEEMERRYELFSKGGVRNIAGYNFGGRLPDASLPERLPYIVCVINGLEELMSDRPAETEIVIARLGHLGRDAGIHLILATTRLSVEVVTGVIKANLPGRICFRVASKEESRTVLDTGEAVELSGSGDLRFVGPKEIDTTPIRGAYCPVSGIAAVVNYLRKQRSPEYDPGIVD